MEVHREAIKAVWQLFDVESDIKSLCWSIDTSPDLKDPENFTAVSQNATEVLITGIPFTMGQTYYFYLKSH